MEGALHPMLFTLATVALAGWGLLILLPSWNVTRTVAETAVFPVFLALLYLVATLMFGPVGFLGYWALRGDGRARRGSSSAEGTRRGRTRGGVSGAIANS